MSSVKSFLNLTEFVGCLSCSEGARMLLLLLLLLLI
jgi:hypothetical protein